jgi:hypothetical protein
MSAATHGVLAGASGAAGWRHWAGALVGGVINGLASPAVCLGIQAQLPGHLVAHSVAHSPAPTPALQPPAAWAWHGGANGALPPTGVQA